MTTSVGSGDVGGLSSWRRQRNAWPSKPKVAARHVALDRMTPAPRSERGSTESRTKLSKSRGSRRAITWAWAIPSVQMLHASLPGSRQSIAVWKISPPARSAPQTICVTIEILSSKPAALGSVISMTGKIPKTRIGQTSLKSPTFAISHFLRIAARLRAAAPLRTAAAADRA